jgi:hypothetical protein
LRRARRGDVVATPSMGWRAHLNGVLRPMRLLRVAGPILLLRFPRERGPRIKLLQDVRTSLAGFRSDPFRLHSHTVRTRQPTRQAPRCCTDPGPGCGRPLAAALASFEDEGLRGCGGILRMRLASLSRRRAASWSLKGGRVHGFMHLLRPNGHQRRAHLGRMDARVHSPLA